MGPKAGTRLAAACALAGAVGLIGGADGPAKQAGVSQGLGNPVRLKATGKDIDSGPHWAHSGPCLHDVDGDGKRDLLVGDYSGLFRLYRNVGTEKEPDYAAAEVLKAGGEDAKVPIY
jgi:hypothetical protein